MFGLSTHIWQFEMKIGKNIFRKTSSGNKNNETIVNLYYNRKRPFDSSHNDVPEKIPFKRSLSHLNSTTSAPLSSRAQCPHPQNHLSLSIYIYPSLPSHSRFSLPLCPKRLQKPVLFLIETKRFSFGKEQRERLIRKEKEREDKERKEKSWPLKRLVDPTFFSSLFFFFFCHFLWLFTKALLGLLLQCSKGLRMNLCEIGNDFLDFNVDSYVRFCWDRFENFECFVKILKFGGCQILLIGNSFSGV